MSFFVTQFINKSKENIHSFWFGFFYKYPFMWPILHIHKNTLRKTQNTKPRASTWRTNQKEFHGNFDALPAFDKAIDLLPINMSYQTFALQIQGQYLLNLQTRTRSAAIRRFNHNDCAFLKVFYLYDKNTSWDQEHLLFYIMMFIDLIHSDNHNTPTN